MAFMEHILNTIVTKMIEASANPSKPNFNHYLFETLTLSIRCVPNTYVEQKEEG